MPPPILDLHLSFKRNTRPAAARVLLRHSDGDTPLVEQPIRMVSCDTPEKAGYAGGPIVAQQKLDVARQRLDGTRRALAVVPTGELIDRYGRLLAYFAPFFRPNEIPPKDDPQRRTFNCDMVALGWAAFFPLYPSLPADGDFALVVAAAVDAWTRRRGAWNEFGSKLLLAYEYRMAIKLAEAETPKAGVAAAFQRSCVDLRSRRDVGRFGWTRVPPPYRLWYWIDDAVQARVDLGVIT